LGLDFNPPLLLQEITMPSEIGILVVHGIGVQKEDFADHFIAEMNHRLDGLSVPTSLIKWEPAFWADLLTQHEEDLYSELSRSHHLDWVTVRKFLINVLADAIAYRREPGEGHDMYRDIHTRIHEHLSRLRASLNNQDKPLIIIAHSLGSVILSDHVWDEQHNQGLGDNAFERTETLAGMVTFGSNIPLFTLGLPEIRALEFPPPSLPENLKAAAKWVNFFDADDVLGYPLKPLSPSYEKTVNADIEINAGGLFTSWNPISHTKYWTDDDFTKPVAKLIRDIVLVNEA
jgi:hypothetical protein